jgi:hypothetical protein
MMDNFKERWRKRANKKRAIQLDFIEYCGAWENYMKSKYNNPRKYIKHKLRSSWQSGKKRKDS